MRIRLALIFVAILVTMLAVTIVASLDRSVLIAGQGLWPDPWFIATLVDAYCGFITFFVWVAYKETRLWKRGIWFVLIMCLGNIAMAVYVLRQLAAMRADAGWEQLLTARNR